MGRAQERTRFTRVFLECEKNRVLFTFHRKGASTIMHDPISNPTTRAADILDLEDAVAVIARLERKIRELSARVAELEAAAQ